MGFAANDSTNSIAFYHNIFGSWVLNLPSDGSASGGSGGSSNESDDEDSSDEEEDAENEDDSDETETDRRRLIKLNACSTQTTGGYTATTDESVNSSIMIGLSQGLLILSAALFWKRITPSLIH